MPFESVICHTSRCCDRCHIIFSWSTGLHKEVLTNWSKKTVFCVCVCIHTPWDLISAIICPHVHCAVLFTVIKKKRKNRQSQWTNAHWSKHSRPLALRTPLPPHVALARGFVSRAAAQTSAMKVEPDLTGHATSQSKKHYSTSGSTAEYISHQQWHSALIMETGQQNKCHLVSDWIMCLL